MNWWARKLQQGQGPPSEAPTRSPAHPPLPSAATPSPAGAPPTQQQPANSFQEWVRRGVSSFRGTDVQEASDNCPSCGSSDYGEIKAPNSRLGGVTRCFSCGYPLEQYGSSTGTGGSAQTAGAVGKDTPVNHARQPDGFYTGFHGDVIVARVEQ